MIKTNSLRADYLAKESNLNREQKLKTVDTIIKLLSEIDHNAEVVPEDNAEMFARLLTSLKGKPLNNDETKLVEEIASY